MIPRTSFSPKKKWEAACVPHLGAPTPSSLTVGICHISLWPLRLLKKVSLQFLSFFLSFFLSLVIQKKFARPIKKIGNFFFLSGCQLRAVEIILLWMVTTTRTCTSTFCGNLLARRRCRACVCARSCGMPPSTFVVCILWLPASSELFLQTYTWISCAEWMSVYFWHVCIRCLGTQDGGACC